MKMIFETIEQTINKSALYDFMMYTMKFHDVTKWFMSSDYCLDDPNKPNDVVSFVIYPYIMDFYEWTYLISNLQKTDLKKCRSISKEFCNFSQQGYIFSFNFIVEKNSYLKNWKNPDVLGRYIRDCITMINSKWKVNTPAFINHYNDLEKRLDHLYKIMNYSKSFNYKLLARTIIVTFLASYVKYLLIREIEKIEIFSWFSDRDKMTSCYDSIYEVLYEINSHCICSTYLPYHKYAYIKDCIPQGIESNMFYDELIRTADFICGGIADYNFKTGEVHKQKHCSLIEEVIANNRNIIVLKIGTNDIARCIYATNKNNTFKVST